MGKTGSIDRTQFQSLLVRADAQQAVGILYLDGLARSVTFAQTALESLVAEASRIIRDLETAAQMQKAILPQASRSATSFIAHAATIPCHAIGGDFFEYVDFSSGDLGFAVCDVAGKGVPAALLSAVVLGIFRAHSHLGLGPAQTLERVGRELLRRPIDARFATMFYGVLSHDGRLQYCNAGHNPPIVLRGQHPLRLELGGPVLGVFEESTYQEGTVTLEPRDLVVVFSDGVTEALSASQEEFTDERLVSYLQSDGKTEPAEVINAILATLLDFCRGAKQSDDITVLALRYRG